MSSGRIVELWRYPVKSMRGERCDALDVTAHAISGDRSYALFDPETGKVGSAKNPRRWPGLLDFAAEWLPPTDSDLAAVAITFPDGRKVRSDDPEVGALLARTFGREVLLSAAPPPQPKLEEYWPDMEGLTHRDAVTDELMPPQTFFDCASVHVLTTQTLTRVSELRPSNVSAARFRPNIIVALDDEQPGFVENAWVGLQIAIGPEVVLQVTGACSRCVMTTLEQPGHAADPGILRALAAENNAHAGVYAEVVRGGRLREGDAFSLVREPVL